MDRVRSLQKIQTRLQGTNFSTSSSRFAPSFVRQPKCPECNKIVRNAPKRQFRVQWGGSGAFVAKISLQKFRCKKFRRDFVARTFAQVRPFCPSFVRQPNGPECTQIVRNAPKREFRFRWGISGACEKFRRDFVARIFAQIRPLLHRVL